MVVMNFSLPFSRRREAVFHEVKRCENESRTSNVMEIYHLLLIYPFRDKKSLNAHLNEKVH